MGLDGRGKVQWLGFLEGKSTIFVGGGGGSPSFFDCAVFFPLICNLILNHLKATLLNPFRGRRGARRWGTLVQQNHGAGGENGTIMVVVFVSCVLQVFC